MTAYGITYSVETVQVDGNKGFNIEGPYIIS